MLDGKAHSEDKEDGTESEVNDAHVKVSASDPDGMNELEELSAIKFVDGII